jgi:hypothetical protein
MLKIAMATEAENCLPIPNEWEIGILIKYFVDFVDTRYSNLP